MLFKRQTTRVGLLSLCFILVTLGGYSQEAQITIEPKPPSIHLTKQGKQILVEAFIPRGITEFELQIESDRNRPVSGAREIFADDPDPEERALSFEQSPLDVRYPVVDIVLEPGMDGVCVFEEEPVGDYIFGGPFFRESLPLKQEITLPSHQLEYWENSLMLDHTTPAIERVYLRKTFPVILRNFRHTVDLLSPDWSGKISIAIFGDGEARETVSARIGGEASESRKAMDMEKMKGTGLSRKRLVGALDLLIEDTLRRQNNNPYSPTYGSLHAFYDLEAKLHRTSYWNWASTQAVKMVLDATKVPEIQELHDTKALIAAMDKVGRNVLKYQLKEEGHPGDGSFLVIWSRRFYRYTKWIGTSDSGVMIRWALFHCIKRLATGPI